MSICLKVPQSILQSYLFVIVLLFSLNLSANEEKCSLVFDKNSELSSPKASLLNPIPNSQVKTLSNVSKDKLSNSESKSNKQIIPEMNQETLNFLSYIDELHNIQVIKLNELEKFYLSISRGEIINPVPHISDKFGVYFEKSSYQVHFEALQEYLNGPHVDLNNVTIWLEQKIIKLKGIYDQRDIVKEYTRDLAKAKKMIFHRIEYGKFLYPLKENKKNIIYIHKPFAMMTTLVTQYHWTKIMGYNPSQFKNGLEVPINKNGDSVMMQPNHPVETIDWFTARKFVDRINHLSKTEDPILKELIPDHQKGDVYRLPNNDEWEYVANYEGQSSTVSKFRSLDDFKKHGWFQENGFNETQPIGELPPTNANGGDFYDLFGNVWEFVESSGSQLPYPMGLDHIVRGGSWMTSNKQLNARGSALQNIYQGGHQNGFRLVREINEQAPEEFYKDGKIYDFMRKVKGWFGK